MYGNHHRSQELGHNIFEDIFSLLHEKEMAAHSSIPAWKIPWLEEPGRLQSMGVAESDMTEQLNLLTNLHLH